jgi:hypothetical protein
MAEDPDLLAIERDEDLTETDVASIGARDG